MQKKSTINKILYYSSALTLVSHLGSGVVYAGNNFSKSNIINIPDSVHVTSALSNTDNSNMLSHNNESITSVTTSVSDHEHNIIGQGLNDIVHSSTKSFHTINDSDDANDIAHFFAPRNNIAINDSDDASDIAHFFAPRNTIAINDSDDASDIAHFFAKKFINSSAREGQPSYKSSTSLDFTKNVIIDPIVNTNEDHNVQPIVHNFTHKSIVNNSIDHDVLNFDEANTRPGDYILNNAEVAQLQANIDNSTNSNSKQIALIDNHSNVPPIEVIRAVNAHIQGQKLFKEYALKYSKPAIDNSPAIHSNLDQFNNDKVPSFEVIRAVNAHIQGQKLFKEYALRYSRPAIMNNPTIDNIIPGSSQRIDNIKITTHRNNSAPSDGEFARLQAGIDIINHKLAAEHRGIPASDNNISDRIDPNALVSTDSSGKAINEIPSDRITEPKVPGYSRPAIMNNPTIDNIILGSSQRIDNIKITTHRNNSAPSDAEFARLQAGIDIINHKLAAEHRGIPASDNNINDRIDPNALVSTDSSGKAINEIPNDRITEPKVPADGDGKKATSDDNTTGTPLLIVNAGKLVANRGVIAGGVNGGAGAGGAAGGAAAVGGINNGNANNVNYNMVITPNVSPIPEIPTLISSDIGISTVSKNISEDITYSIYNQINDRLSYGQPQLIAVAAGDNDMIEHAGAWISGLYGKSKKSKDSSLDAYKGNIVGSLIGYDIKTNEATTLGTSFGHLNSKYKIANTKGSNVDATSNLIAVYLQQEMGLYDLQSMISFSKTTFKINNSRQVNGGKTSKGKFRNNNLDFATTLSYKLNVKPYLTILPNVGIKYGRLQDGSYNETGGGIKDLTIAARKQNTLIGSLGAKALMPCSLDNGINIIPNVSATLENHFNNYDKSKVSYVVNTNGSQTFKVKSSKTRYNLGAGLLVQASNFEVNASYNLHMHKKYHSQEGSLKFKVNF